MCKQESSSDESTKIHTRKYIVITKITISDFHTSFYIPAIQNLDFHLPHVRILGTKYCDAQPLNDVNYFNMFYGVVITLMGKLQALLINYNHNTMLEKDQCL